MCDPVSAAIAVTAVTTGVSIYQGQQQKKEMQKAQEAANKSKPTPTPPPTTKEDPEAQARARRKAAMQFGFASTIGTSTKGISESPSLFKPAPIGSAPVKTKLGA